MQSYLSYFMAQRHQSWRNANARKLAEGLPPRGFVATKLACTSCRVSHQRDATGPLRPNERRQVPKLVATAFQLPWQPPVDSASGVANTPPRPRILLPASFFEGGFDAHIFFRGLRGVQGLGFMVWPFIYTAFPRIGFMHAMAVAVAGGGGMSWLLSPALCSVA
jgi:hypothetical protein